MSGEEGEREREREGERGLFQFTFIKSVDLMSGGGISSLTGSLCFNPLLDKQLQGSTEKVVALLLVLEVLCHVNE